MELIFALIVIVLLIAFYFLPFIIAVNRKHKNRVPIFLVNLIFGWSFLGWIAALVWSFTANTEA